MIFTFPQFQNLWMQHINAYIPNANIQQLYQSYLIRENYFEDYLDILGARHKITKATKY